MLGLHRGFVCTTAALFLCLGTNHLKRRQRSTSSTCCLGSDQASEEFRTKFLIVRQIALLCDFGSDGHFQAVMKFQ